MRRLPTRKGCINAGWKKKKKKKQKKNGGGYETINMNARKYKKLWRNILPFYHVISL
jgi:hypothetical protein